jgi:plasmid stabilization system protein ParE
VTEFPLAWEVILTDVAEGERESLFLNVGKARGPDYARRWLTSLVDTTDAIAEFPGPRSFPQSHPESERRREEVRYRIYGGPDKKTTLSVSCHIFFAIFDPRQGEESGRILILRIIGSQTEATSQLLGKMP